MLLAIDDSTLQCLLRRLGIPSWIPHIGVSIVFARNGAITASVAYCVSRNGACISYTYWFAPYNECKCIAVAVYFSESSGSCGVTAIASASKSCVACGRR